MEEKIEKLIEKYKEDATALRVAIDKASGSDYQFIDEWIGRESLALEFIRDLEGLLNDL